MWCILRKWRQNAWRRMFERVFFVNLQLGIWQRHNRSTSSQTVFRDWTPSIGNLFYKMLEKHLWNSFYWSGGSIKEAQNTSVQRNVSNFTDQHKKQSSGGVLAKENVLKNFAKFTEKPVFRSLFFNKVAGWKPETFWSNNWKMFCKTRCS